MLIMVMKVILHMGHHFILTSIALLLAPEAHNIIYFTLDEKLNLQCIYYYSRIKCGGVKALVNMVYVTSIP